MVAAPIELVIRMKWIADHLQEAALAAFAGLTTWLAKHIWGFGGRISRIDKRVSIIERTHITRDQFDELRTSMIATFTNGMDRIEQRQEALQELSNKILLHLADKK